MVCIALEQERSVAKFIIPYTGELRIEAQSAHEARQVAHAWRKFLMECVRGHLEELRLERVSMAPMPEVTEVDADWLDNQRLRQKFRRE
jgi:hypothetical protein